MGRYMLLRPIDHSGDRTKVVRQLRAGAVVPVGTEATIDGVDYLVSDVKDVTCVASEGELPFVALLGLAAVSVDLSTADERCASIQREGDAVSVYTGRYVTLAEIAAANLRAFEGWPSPRFAA